ncbi:TauD/TfdA family dioxygenase [Acidisphaera sp. S103]|uniref:TauD/TfdA dioxygenase family protein n=1 Tax=Acidisphaera sp. S103 TaxID=1747223 RepID=UPI00131A9D40|nr:TauD/TfdA family dioxygenase [Acidisphaera sp. S103]
MLSIQPTGAILGATVRGIDLSRPIPEPEFGRILLALGQHGVLRFPGQQLDIGDVKRFSELFGEIQGNPISAVDATRPYPEVGILSNVKENGVYIGSPDAGQDWHTDMSYRETIGFVNVLYGIRIPRRDGKPLGGTEFANMHAAYDALPDDIKSRLDGMTATHDFEKFWEHMRRDKASGRPAMTDEQRMRRPPVVHPVFLTHPITGRKVLYCNEGYAMRINELPQAESDEMLDYLFRHQLEMRFRYTHDWNENDLLIWDHLGTIHRAIADYGPDEIRLMRRCQVMATKVFDAAFLRPALEAAGA